MSHSSIWRAFWLRLVSRAANTGKAHPAPAIQIQAGCNVVVTEPITLRATRPTDAPVDAAPPPSAATILSTPMVDRERLALTVLAWMVPRTEPEQRACVGLLTRRHPGIEKDIEKAATSIAAFAKVLQELVQDEAAAVQAELAAAQQHVDAQGAETAPC